MSIAKELMELETLFRNGTLTREEFETAKQLVLANKSTSSADPLDEIRKQNQVAQLDRQWSIEREKYLVSHRRGPSTIPTQGSSIAGGVVIVLFGVFWTAMAASIASFAPFPIGILFPGFGILFIIFGVANAIRSFSKAEQYAVAEAEYKRRRQEIIDTQNRN